MGNRLTNIDQSHFIEIYKERFENQGSYADKPLIIWRSFLNDDVELNFDEIISELTEGKKREDYNYPALRKLYIDHLKDNSLGVSHAINPHIHKICVVYFDISDMEINHPISFEEFSNLITKDWLKRLNDEIRVPIILHLPFIEQPEAFKGYDQYVFEPDFEEWKEELSEYKEPLIKHLIEFLESSTSEEERNYRWCWYFERQRDGKSSPDLKCHFEGNGCDFPSCWIDGIWNLRGHFNIPMAQIPKNYIPPKPVKISEIPVDEFKAFFNEGVSEDVVEDFRKYLIENKVEIQGNKRNT